MLMKFSNLWPMTALLLTLGLASCAETLRANDADLEGEFEDEDEAPPTSISIPSRSGKFSHRVAADGSVITTVVDASDHEVWRRLDLDSGYSREEGWDLSFRRFFVLSNGGVSGDGGVQVLRLRDAEFGDVTAAPGPEAEWLVDLPDGEADDDSEADSPFNDGVNDWYDYELSTHKLTSRKFVYVIRSTEARFYKLIFDDYYSDVGTSGVLTFRWARIPGPGEELPPPILTPGEPEEPEEPEEPDTPSTPGLFKVNASSYTDWIYLDLKNGLVTVTTPETSLDWDLAVRRVAFLTNSGTSGPGQGGAKLDSSSLSYEELTSTDTTGFTIDRLLEASGAPGAADGTGNTILEPWYDYFGNGSLAPKDVNFVIRAADGSTYGKLRILSYLSGVYDLAFEPITVSP